MESEEWKRGMEVGVTQKGGWLKWWGGAVG